VFVPSKRVGSRSALGTVLSHFSHGDIGHLFLNLLALYLFGPHVEKVLGPIAYCSFISSASRSGPCR
jgi:membrane associated rhomboid family serine protease